MMNKLNQWAKRKARKWLGVDRDYAAALNRINIIERRLAHSMTCAADVSFKGNTQIIIVSRLNGGRVSIFDLECKSPLELHERALHILGPSWPEAVIDAPPDFARFVKNEQQRFY